MDQSPGHAKHPVGLGPFRVQGDSAAGEDVAPRPQTSRTNQSGTLSFPIFQEIHQEGTGKEAFLGETGLVLAAGEWEATAATAIPPTAPPAPRAT